uniref:Uncharacterized protein n=1 Tax=Candidatus Kentrum sp. FW TaxID=2126338 RepID=A0A450TEK2_9GAMM|nr:MAG: hypothetical protein BECKFW1821B_GA0114236_110310 [Candidatus Kentron sp. FW]
MDENEYRDTCQIVNPLACPFQKAVLTRQCGCEYLQHFHIAEREEVGCRMPLARERCVRLLGLFRGNARFALKLMDSPTVSLPHGKEIKAQAGGLRGLAKVMGIEGHARRIENVHGLVNKAMEVYGDMENLPYPEIVREIVHYEGRTRRRRR